MLAAAASSFVAVLILYLALQIVAPERASSLESIEFPSDPAGLFILLFFVGTLFWGAALAATFVHGRSIGSLVAPLEPIRWKLVRRLLALLAIINGLLTAASLGMAAIGIGPELATITFAGLGWEHAIWLLPLLLSILVQTSGEDVFFKGLLLRQLGAATEIFWVAPVVVAAGFTAVHVGNPDLNASVRENLWLVLGAFALSELVIIGLMMWSGGMEIPLVMHFVNNAVIFLVIGDARTQANDLTLWVTEYRGDQAALAELWGLGWLALANILLVAALLWATSPFHIPRYRFETGGSGTTTAGQSSLQPPPPSLHAVPTTALAPPPLPASTDTPRPA